jgi:ribosomal protein RSM22 (predicted rRNA methylase)
MFAVCNKWRNTAKNSFAVYVRQKQHGKEINTVTTTDTHGKKKNTANILKDTRQRTKHGKEIIRNTAKTKRTAKKWTRGLSPTHDGTLYGGMSLPCVRRRTHGKE